MGTNYYAEMPACANACDHCAERARWHIGKSLTMFEGYLERPAPPGAPAGGVLSWRDWKRVLRQQGVEVWDEYGTQYSSEDFIRKVESTELAARRRQYDWIMSHSGPRDRDWLCPDGFSFYNGEFS